jgi:hypothetical protein
MIKKYIPMVIVAVVVGAGAFFGGMQYAKSQIPARTGFANFAAGAGGATGTAGAAGRRAGAAGGTGAVIGQNVTADAQSITVQTTGSGSKIVFFSTSTMIMKASAGSVADLTSGQQVVVNGTANSDGSVTAQSIQLRPQGAGFPGGGNQGQAQRPQSQQAQ